MLPEAIELKKLRDEGLSYREIGLRYDVAGPSVWHKLNQAGLLVRCRTYDDGRQTGVNFQTRASTTMALIRDGKNSYRELAKGLGYKTESAVKPIIRSLVALGFVTHEPYKARTLQLTELGRQSVSLIQLAKRRPDGVLEAYH